MAEFILKPNDFQKQVDSFKSTKETVSALKYTLEKNGISLQSIDKYEECITAMNDLITTFAEFAESPPVWLCVPLCGHSSNQPGKHPHCPRQPL